MQYFIQNATIKTLRHRRIDAGLTSSIPTQTSKNVILLLTHIQWRKAPEKYCLSITFELKIECNNGQ